MCLNCSFHIFLNQFFFQIRLFGDPRDEGSEIPTLKLNIQASLEDTNQPAVVRQETHDVVCDFVDGFAFGEAIGIGIRSVNDWWTVQSVQSSNKARLVLNINKCPTNIFVSSL